MSKATGCSRPFRLAVASGKGGTGKTTISVALALASRGQTTLLDCDVEEPNGALFLSSRKARASESRTHVTVQIPEVDNSRCTACGKCKALCRYNAIVILNRTVMIFHELCHSCGGCALVCPTGAIHEKPKVIGEVREWESGSLRFIEGEMQVGHAMSVPLIRAVKQRALETSSGDDLLVIDSPPGTSCPMVAAVKDADAVLLVTEPTPFGLHDLTLAIGTIRKMGLPFAVAINRSDLGDNRVEEYCNREAIPVLARIANDRKVAEIYSNGGTLLEAGSQYRPIMENLLEQVRTIAQPGELQ